MDQDTSGWKLVSPIFSNVLQPLNDGSVRQEGTYYNYNHENHTLQLYSIHASGPQDVVQAYAQEVKLFCNLLEPIQLAGFAHDLPSLQPIATGLSTKTSQATAVIEGTVETINQALGRLPEGLRPHQVEEAASAHSGNLAVDLDFLGIATTMTAIEDVHRHIKELINNVVGLDQLLANIQHVFPEFDNLAKQGIRSYGFHFKIDPTIDSGMRHQYAIHGSGEITVNIPKDTSNGVDDQITISAQNVQADLAGEHSAMMGTVHISAILHNPGLFIIKNPSSLSCGYTMDGTMMVQQHLLVIDEPDEAADEFTNRRL